MKIIILQRDTMRAVVLPDFGGAVAELSLGELHALRMNYASLGISNVLAGGIPVLFPFVSRTKDDEADFDGASCTMPMHGFVKDMPFSVVEQESDRCELRICSSEATKLYYPYDFELRLIYRVDSNALHTEMQVKNTGSRSMPFAAGFHPYFLTPDRSRPRFQFGLKEYWDYVHPDAQGTPRRGKLDGEICLADTYDTVFFNGDASCVLENEEIGYRVKLVGDESFNVVTICTTLENASCVEPWQAKPGAAHDRSACQVLKAGECAAYCYRIEMERL